MDHVSGVALGEMTNLSWIGFWLVFEARYHTELFGKVTIVSGVA